MVISVLLLMSLWWIISCRQTTSSEYPNQAPTTTIANIPVNRDTLFALVELQWDGGDEDGFIKGYEYRYRTTYLTTGEQITEDWQFTTENKVTIAFNSKDVLNEQEFEVRSVDNDDTVDPTPAVKTFYTIQTIPPDVKILKPLDGQQAFAINEVTDWWWGVELSFEGSDADGEIVEYAWSVDDGDWTWTTDTTLYITPDMFSEPLNGNHVIRITARDNTNITSSKGDSVTVELVEATFEKDILIIDETLESDFPSQLKASDAHVDSFYADIFGVDDEADWWDYRYHELRGDPLPPRSLLGKYKLVIWHADNRPASAPHGFAFFEEYLQDYMNVGGDLILSGWRVLKSFDFEKDFENGVTFEEGTFVRDYLHIVSVQETPYFPGDFSGASGQLGFSDVEVDADKLQGFPYSGKLSQVNIITERAGFTNSLYRYNNPPDSRLPEFTGTVCALIYNGTSFNVAILGFPMFFIKTEHAKIMGRELLTELGY